jgi:hypothetical protein
VASAARLPGYSVVGSFNRLARRENTRLHSKPMLRKIVKKAAKTKPEGALAVLRV